jgi:hypothetical protein
VVVVPLVVEPDVVVLPWPPELEVDVVPLVEPPEVVAVAEVDDVVDPLVPPVAVALVVGWVI